MGFSLIQTKEGLNIERV